MFESLVKRNDYTLKWSELGKSLYIESNRKFFRRPKQCRQRFLNHLDPSKLKKYWLLGEDFCLIEFVKFEGKKWAIISKKLSNKRKEHSIKNRFTSLITKQVKCDRCELSEPEIINRIYEKLLLERMEQSSNSNEVDHERNQIEYQKYRPQVSSNAIDNYICYQNQSKANIPIYHKDLSTQNVENMLFEMVREHQNEHYFDNNSEELRSKGYISLNNEGENSKLENRIRTDLLLQQDPFDMLKVYFERKGM